MTLQHLPIVDEALSRRVDESHATRHVERDDAKRQSVEYLQGRDALGCVVCSCDLRTGMIRRTKRGLAAKRALWRAAVETSEQIEDSSASLDIPRRRGWSRKMDRHAVQRRAWRSASSWSSGCFVSADR